MPSFEVEALDGPQTDASYANVLGCQSKQPRSDVCPKEEGDCGDPSEPYECPRPRSCWISNEENINECVEEIVNVPLRHWDA